MLHDWKRSSIVAMRGMAAGWIAVGGAPPGCAKHAVAPISHTALQPQTAKFLLTLMESLPFENLFADPQL
jgi:hypothetical protein